MAQKKSTKRKAKSQPPVLPAEIAAPVPADWKERLQSLRDELNLELVLSDLKEMDVPLMGKIMNSISALREVCEANGLPLFSRAATVFHQWVSSVIMGDLLYHTGMSLVLHLHELLEKEFEHFFFSGQSSESFENHLAALERILEKKEEAMSEEKGDEAQEDVLQRLENVTDISILSDFVTEAFELMEIAETEFMELEKDPGNLETINSLFRGIHTIKGSAGFLGLTVLAGLTHEAETLLDKVRKGQMRATSDFINGMLGVNDCVKRLLLQLKELLNPVVDKDKVAPVKIDAARKFLHHYNSGKVGEALPPPKVEIKEAEAAPREEVHPEEKGASLGKSASMDVVRVPSGKLDELSELVGELVVALSILMQNETITSVQNREVHEKLNQMEKITESLRDKVLEVRMFPVGSVFAKLTRQVRDLSQKLGKKVNLETHGNDTLVDKQVIDEIYSPLMHIVRNAIDHGLENTEGRKAAGKPSEGKVTISAFHRGDSIWVEVQDDGRGLDKEKILAKAEKVGIISEKTGLSDGQIYDLIFHPGFSTAEKVTDVSGRGVGMDVVKKMVEKLRGKIVISSEPGKGSSFSLRLPMSTSIIEGLVVRIGPSKFVAPLLSVNQTVTPRKSDLKSIHDREGECFLYQGRLVPILRLYDFYGLRPDVTDPSEALIMVVENGSGYYGLMVDELLHRQQVVIKNIKDRFEGLRGISGGTILGNGQVGFILDTEEIIKHAREAGEARQREGEIPAAFGSRG